MPPFSPQWPRRSSQDRQSPVNPQNSPKHLAHRGSISGHEPRLLVRRNSGDKGPGEWIDVDKERRSRNRSNSTPPDNRRHHHPVDHRHRPTQDANGQIGFAPVSANESWAWGQHWVNTWWSPRHTQVQAQVQVTGQWAAHGGHEPREGQRQREGENRGRSRRSSDATRPTPIPAPAPRRMSTPSPVDLPPVIPGITTAGGMGLRNLLRKRSQNRPKILFYNKDEPYYGFTNFSPHPVMYRGKRYPTSEHLFQSFKVGMASPVIPFFWLTCGCLPSKFIHKPNLMEHIRTCGPRPSVAFTEARRFANEVHPNWKHDNISAVSPLPF